MQQILPPPRLVLLGLGAASDPDGPARRLPAAAERLSRLCGLPRLPIDAAAETTTALTALQGCQGPWLADLPIDPGLWRPQGRWAEALGAWRQPCLLLIAPGQLASGLPAAGTALLERWGVPLLGLIQHGGAWEPGSRRRDGLPWLGWLAADAEASRAEGAQATDAQLLLTLQARWRRLMAELA